MAGMEAGRLDRRCNSVQAATGIWTKVAVLEVMRSDQIRDLSQRECGQELLMDWLWYLNKRKQHSHTGILPEKL